MKYSSFANMSHCWRNSHSTHSVTCHLEELAFPPLPQHLRLVLDSAIPEGCKAELT